MSFAVELFQERGPITAQRGTIQEIVNNISFRRDSSSESAVPYNTRPLRRPIGQPFTFSVTNYHYFRFAGTHNGLTRPRITIVGNYRSNPFQGGGVFTPRGTRLYYRQGGPYATPVNSGVDAHIYLPPGETVQLFPLTSPTGPHTGLTYTPIIPRNQTRFTGYIETKMLIEHIVYEDIRLAGNFEFATITQDTASRILFNDNSITYGNIGELLFRCEVDSYELEDY